MTLHTYADAEMMAIDVANRLAGDLRQALDQRARVTFAVPGGSTPGPVFDALCDTDLDWARVDVLLTDERWVPEVHIRSNTRLVRERLLVGRAASARFVPLYERAEQPEEVLDGIRERLDAVLPVTVLMLGMGVDMHTASLFPGAEGTAEALRPDAPVLVPVRSDAVRDVRVTLAARVLNEAMAKHLVITGAAKKAACDRARSLPVEQAPVAAVLRNADIYWCAE